ncbi:MAG TPA: protoporphyrinogen oxidase [Vicinamibacterales bacterium]|nr:protoporphyrinogen oxidase [Vicinamibacterales bacterium]
MRTDVVIVGAGIAGLSAAYELTRRGRGVRVLEASRRAGGLIHTEHTGGFTIEAGPDSILNAKPAALTLIRELGIASALQTVRPGARAFVLKGTVLHALPQPSLLGIPLTAEALARYDLLSPAGRERIAIEPTIPPRRGDDDEAVGAFFRRRFGDEAVDLIAQPLLGGIHAGDIEQLSMRSLFPSLVAREREHGRVTIPAAPRGGDAGFSSLRGGMSTLVDALVRSLPPGTIEFNASVRSLADIDAGCTILALPAHAAAPLIAPLDADAAALAATVPYVSTASVALAWPRASVPHPLDGTGFVVSRRYSAVRITACTWVSSKWEDRAPDGTALLRAFVGGAHDPAVAELPDDDLIAIVRRDLRDVMGITAAPSLARAYRWPRAGAQHVVGHLDRVAEIERRLAPHRVFVAGSGFRAVGIPDCVADGRRVAAAVTDALTERRRL